MRDNMFEIKDSVYRVQLAVRDQVKPFFQSEIVGLTGISRSAVKRTVMRMECVDTLGHDFRLGRVFKYGNRTQNCNSCHFRCGSGNSGCAIEDPAIRKLVKDKSSNCSDNHI